MIVKVKVKVTEAVSFLTGKKVKRDTYKRGKESCKLRDRKKLMNSTMASISVFGGKFEV